jgi:hypothetical protein
MQTPVEIAEYQETAGARLTQTAGYSGQQPGDPVRAGEAMIRIVENDHPPRHLVLGEIAYNGITGKLKERREQIEAWKETSLSADFPK